MKENKKTSNNDLFRLIGENGHVYNTRTRAKRRNTNISIRDSISLWGIKTSLFFSILVIFSFSMAILGFYTFFSYKDFTMKDVTEIRGTISKYYLSGNKSKVLNITLNEYPEEFQILAQALDYKSFEAREFNGGQIKLLISKKDFENIINNPNRQKESVTMCGIFTSKNNYLDINTYNDYEKFQSRCALFLGIILIPAGIVIFKTLIRI